MKKIIQKSALFLLSVMLLFVFVGLKNVKGATGEAFNIITNPGADMSSQMNVNWHTLIEGTYLEYTVATDTAYANATKIDGECAAMDFGTEAVVLENIKGYPEGGIQCGVSLNNLAADTEYIYRVGKTTMSDNYKFVTASGSGAFDFLFMADPQFSSLSEAKVWYANMDKAFELNPNIKFTYLAGDIVNHGVDANEWANFFNTVYQQNGTIVATPGNHDYYVKGGVPLDARFYNVHFRNPDNGDELTKNSSYYFKYNNTLFIAVDSEAKSTWSSQKEWFGEVVRNNPATFIVVLMHTSVYGSGNKSNADYLRSQWMDVFDKYGVDVALTGHDHIYSRSYRIYNDQVINHGSLKGTYYITGGVAGNGLKYNTNDLDKTKSEKYMDNVSSFSILTVEEGSMSLKFYDSTGTIRDTFVFGARRDGNISEEFDSQSFVDNIDIKTSNEDLTSARITWPSDGYGYVAGIDITNNGSKVATDYYMISEKDNNYLISNLTTSTDYTLNVNVRFVNGTELTKTIAYDTKYKLGSISNIEVVENKDGYKISWDNALDSSVLSSAIVYFNGEEVSTFNPRRTNSNITVSADKFLATNTLEIRGILIADKENEVLICQETVSLQSDATISLNKDSLTLQEKANETLNATVSDATLKVVWSSSDASVATVDANGKVEALKVGTATITATIEGTTISSSCVVTVEEAPKTVTINKTAVTLQEASNETLKATLSDSTLKVVWSSSDASVATVDANGKVEAKKAGKATITATIEGTTISSSCVVTVETAPVVDPTISLNKTTVTLQEASNETLKATLSDSTLKVVWSSSDASVATVDANGKVEAKKAGNATITATIEGTTISANCTVTVEAQDNCNSGTVIIFLSALGLVTFVLRRRRLF